MKRKKRETPGRISTAKFRTWCAEDVFENILQALVADTEKYLLVEIDSTFSCG